MKKKPKIVLIGPYSEIGGVSIHIKRLMELLHNKYNFFVINDSRSVSEFDHTLDLLSAKFYRYFWILFNADLVHIHSGTNLLRIVHLLTCLIFRKSVLVTLHSYRKPSSLVNFLMEIVPKNVITVNDQIKSDCGNNKATVLNAFIPPSKSNNQVLQRNMQKLLQEFKEKENFIIAGNAFRIVDFEGGDLYGLDQIIELGELLHNDHQNVKIIFFVSSLIGCKEKYNEYHRHIQNMGLSEVIYLFNETVPFIRIIEAADLIIRPTLSDGDALTIRESLYLRKPIIASDAVKRPFGTIIYKSKNLDDLYAKVKDVMNKEDKFIPRLPEINYQKLYTSIYEASNTKL